jgi:hypothetical protein
MRNALVETKEDTGAPKHYRRRELASRLNFFCAAPARYDSRKVFEDVSHLRVTICKQGSESAIQQLRAEIDHA